jgi:hypothetical protein
MSFYSGNLLSSSIIKPFVMEVHWFFTYWHTICPIFLNDHGHNFNAFINFVQHVKLVFKVKGTWYQIVGNALDFNPTKSTNFGISHVKNAPQGPHKGCRTQLENAQMCILVGLCFGL